MRSRSCESSRPWAGRVRVLPPVPYTPLPCGSLCWPTALPFAEMPASHRSRSCVSISPPVYLVAARVEARANAAARARRSDSSKKQINTVGIPESDLEFAELMMTAEALEEDAVRDDNE